MIKLCAALRHFGPLDKHVLGLGLALVTDEQLSGAD